MTAIEVVFYSRITGEVRKSKHAYRSTIEAERELRRAGFTQNPRLPDIWYTEKFFAKVREQHAGS